MRGVIWIDDGSVELDDGSVGMKEEDKPAVQEAPEIVPVWLLLELSPIVNPVPSSR